MKSAEEWTNELDQEARQRGFWKECLYKVKKIRAEARVAALEEAAEHLETYDLRACEKKNRTTVANVLMARAIHIRQLAASPAPEVKG